MAAGVAVLLDESLHLLLLLAQMVGQLGVNVGEHVRVRALRPVLRGVEGLPGRNTMGKARPRATVACVKPRAANPPKKSKKKSGLLN